MPREDLRHRQMNTILAQLAQVWKQYPSWRLGQLISNLKSTNGDIFYLSDAELSQLLTQSIKIEIE